MQENVRVNRFTLVEAFFLEVNVEVSNFYQFMSEFKYIYIYVIYIYIYIYVYI